MKNKYIDYNCSVCGDFLFSVPLSEDMYERVAQDIKIPVNYITCNECKK